MKQDVPIGCIGVACRNKAADHVDDHVHRLGHAGLDRRAEAAQRQRILLVDLRGAVCQLTDRDAAFRRARHDLVLDIRDVAHIGDMIFAIKMTQQPEEDIEHDDRTPIADMRMVVDGRTADIHPHILRIDRREELLVARQCVVDLEGHHLILTPSARCRPVPRFRSRERRESGTWPQRRI